MLRPQDTSTRERKSLNGLWRFVLDPEGEGRTARWFAGPLPGTREMAVPAITHVDGTARVQTVHEEHSPLYYKLIDRFGQASGTPVILNTSFNLKGDAIVNTPAQAHSTFMRSGMDALVLGNTVITKE